MSDKGRLGAMWSIKMQITYKENELWLFSLSKNVSEGETKVIAL